MPNTQKPELLPCPWCDVGSELNDPHPNHPDNHVNFITPHLPDCPLHPDFPSYMKKGAQLDRFIKVWNTRADGWQPIESAPETGPVFVTDGKTCWYIQNDINIKEQLKEIDAWLGTESWETATHWLPRIPLPEPPKADE